LRTDRTYRFSASFIKFIHDEGIALSFPGIEPVHEREPLNRVLLASAAEQPFQGGFGIDYYPTIYDKAACLFFSIAGGHIFYNGNKRTAVLVVDQFLLANSIYLLLSNAEIKRLAEQTASYRERGEDQRDVRDGITRLLRDNSAELKVLRKVDMKMYGHLHRVKNVLRGVMLVDGEYEPFI
jgi:prophage maintenance system killer protein